MAKSSVLINWNDIEQVLASAFIRTIYLYGPPGIGKTWAALYLGRTNLGVHAVTLTEETPSAELRGHYMPGPQGMEWHDGAVTASMRPGGRLVANEITRASSDAWSYMYPVLESTETARLTLPSKEVIQPAEGFHVICTDNEAPGCLPEALQDRFDAIIEVTEPHPAALERLSEPLRAAFLSTLHVEPERRTSLRSWLSVERMRGDFGLLRACLLAFGAERGQEVHDALCLAGA